MIDNCITKNTNPIILKGDNQPVFNEKDTKKWNKMAESISKETGVPQRLIYTEPYLFHLNNWYKINGTWYYYKSDGCDFHFINELLGVLISEYFGLETIHYKVAKLFITGKDPEYGLLSENFCNPKITYKDAWQYKLMPKRDMSILEELRRLCKTNQEYRLLLDDIKRFFVRDFFTFQNDRNGNNFLFKETESGIRLAPLYDYENSFELLSVERYRNQIGELDLNNKDTLNLIKHDYKFKELFDKLMDIKINELLSKIEEEHKIIIDEDNKRFYNYESNKKKELLKTLNIVK